MEIIGGIIWALIGAVMCNKMANSQGRDVAKWTRLGLLFGLVAIIVLYWRGDTDEVALEKVRRSSTWTT